jgi:uroporphyrinogen-III synthase
VYKLWAAKANTDAELPNRLYLESASNSGLAEKALELLNAGILKNKKVFISQERDYDSLLEQQLKIESAQLLAKSGIETQALPFEFPQAHNFDFIFFNSRNAVKYFMESNPEISNYKIAAFGSGTAKELLKYNISADFIGEHSDPKKVAAMFNQRYTSAQKIFFPLSQHSLKSVIQHLDAKHQVEVGVVYTSVAKKDVQLEEADLYVFTSPSNVHAFLKGQNLNGKLFIAIGPSTADALKDAGYACHAIAQSADDLGIYHALYKAQSENI